MKFRLLLSLSVLGMVGAGMVGSACAEDDVYVDLSVLNSLQAAAPAAVVQPLFPDVKNAPAPKKPRAVKRKKTEKRQEVKLPEVKAEAMKAEDKVEMKAEAAPQPDKTETSAAETVPAVDSAKNNLDTLRQAIAENSIRKEPVAAETPAAETAVSAEMPADASLPVETAVVPVENTAVVVDDKSGESLSEALNNNVPAETQLEPEKVSNAIKFGAESSELTEADKQQIDAIMAGFEDAVNHKVAITAYNLDDGKEVFYRKKQSLDRAIAIRSYLLNKGYKNYSIKVINIPAGDERVNTVDVVELR
ncbi:MAG: OmpA family protein [Pseudomonadota bacterium]|nr:OmpA family protein [Pseudomonadota bacterium]